MMKAKIVFHDGSWIIGCRVSWWEILKSRMPETQGTHHWWAEEWSESNALIGRGESLDRILCHKVRVAVPINSMKYCVFVK
jgi:hypothetical protein